MGRRACQQPYPDAKDRRTHHYGATQPEEQT
jgi:hypothetical protein